MAQIATILGISTMQIDRRHDEMVFCHAMDRDELKTHLEQLLAPGECLLCEWFGISAKERI